MVKRDTLHLRRGMCHYIAAVLEPSSSSSPLLSASVNRRPIFSVPLRLVPWNPSRLLTFTDRDMCMACEDGARPDPVAPVGRTDGNILGRGKHYVLPLALP